jgi:hypothetical protein
MSKHPYIACSKCGVEIEAGCNCNAPYLPSGARAMKAAIAFPTMSHRAIADKVNVDESTVRLARKKLSTNPKAGAGNPAPAAEIPKTRVGKDGKNYKATKQMTKMQKWAEQQREMGAPYPEFKIEKAKDIGRMPNDTRQKYEESIDIIVKQLVKLELMTEYAAQMSTELRHLLTDKLNEIKKHIATISKKMFGKDSLRDLNRPLCDVEIPLRKEDENHTLN